MRKASTAGRWLILAIAAITAIGFALRLARYQQSIFGDELSTFYIVHDRGLSQIIGSISGDAEISPPLYFLLAWLSTKLGSDPELMRLPSLIAGTVSIPLVYLVGARAINRETGLIAAAIMALSPFMIFYSADGRGYAVAIALLLGSTLAMLAGARDGRRRWWVAYGLLSLLAMYTHYTAGFVLIAQLGWLIWAHPESRRPAVVANAAAAILFLPWVPSLLDDADSPTVDILSALQGAGLAAKRSAVEIWAVGYPFQTPRQLPGSLAGLLGLAGFVVAAVVGLGRHLRSRGRVEGGRPVPLVSPGITLAAALALSTFVGELVILLATGNDLLGARNLTTSSAGLALLIGAVLASAGRVWGSICTVAVIACFGVGAAGTLESDSRLPDTEAVAAYVRAHSSPGDAFLDMYTSPLVNPVPVSALSRYESSIGPASPLLPKSPPPFLLGLTEGQISDSVKSTICGAPGGKVFVLDAGDRVVEGAQGTAILTSPAGIAVASDPDARVSLPGVRVLEQTTFGGADELRVTTLEAPRDRLCEPR